MKKAPVSRWLLGFFIFPFFTALYALFNAKDKGARIVLVLFTALFGYFAIPGQGSDMYGYLHSLSDASMQIDAMADYYTMIVSYLVSRFTNNGHFLLAIYGIVVGFLFGKSLALFDKGKEKRLFYIIIFCFANVFSLSTFGGVRNITAFYLFFWGSIAFIKTNRWVFTIPIVLSCFVHFSFLIYTAVFLIYLFLKDSPILVYVIFAVSLVAYFSGILSLLGENLSFLSVGISEKADVYLNNDIQDYIENYRTGAIQNGLVWTLYIEMAVCVILSLVARSKSKNKSDTQMIHFFVFVILLLSFANIFSSVPHLSTRISRLCVATAVYPIYIYCRDNWKIQVVRTLCFAAIVGWLILSVIEIRKIAEITPLSLVILPLPVAGVSDMTVWDFISSII